MMTQRVPWSICSSSVDVYSSKGYLHNKRLMCFKILRSSNLREQKDKTKRNRKITKHRRYMIPMKLNTQGVSE